MAATMVGGALLSASFTVLIEQLAYPQLLNFFRHRTLDNRLLRKLRLKLISVDRLLVDVEEKQITDPKVKWWLNDLKHAVYEAENFLDELGAEMKAAAQASTSQVLEIASKLKELVQTFQDILEAKDALGLSPGNLGDQERTPTLLNRQTTSLVDDSSVFGRDGDKDAIVKLLLSEDAGSTCPGVVSVVGMGGIGKTTLAQLVFNDSRVKEWFDRLKVWICVCEEVDVFKLTKNILKEIGSSHCDSMTPNQLQLELQHKAKGERILLVMDDVWNNIDWEFLLKPLKSVAPGSKILVTTREERILSKVRRVSSHQLKILSEEYCWLLFANYAFDGHISEVDAYLKELETEIIRKCKGLPLAVKTIGSLLYSETRPTAWENILKSNIWDLDDGIIIPALKLSYHYLPPYLKRCFVYCAMFPKDYLFKKEELIFLWMAEGFIIHNNNESGELEEIGEKYFEDLLSRSFFQKHVRNGEFGFVMHDLLNDLAKSVEGEFCYNIVEDNSNKLTEKTRRLFYEVRDRCNALKDISKAQNLRTFRCLVKQAEAGHVVDCLPRFGRLRVLRLFGDIDWVEDGINISLLDSSAKHLRYMELYQVSILNLPKTMPYLQRLIITSCYNLTSLPDSIGDMKDLRHLSVLSTRIDSLPESIGNLKILRHLDLQSTQIKSLPDSIGGLKDLRYLNLWETGIELLPDSIGDLKDLRYMNLQSTQIKSLPDSIGGLKDLRHLNLQSTQIESLSDLIGDLKDLRHLNLQSTRIELLPDSIGNLKNLRHLNLRSTRIDLLPDSIGNLKDLRYLNLWWTRIKSLPDSIGDLKDLRHLDLQYTSVERLPDSICGLHNLHHLSLFSCKRLVELPAKMSDLVNLCHLDIRGTRLKSMPPHMGKLIKLHTLSYFVVGKEEGSCIAELGHFRNLQGELALGNLQNVKDEQDALKAKIKDKSRLEELKYVWEDDDDNSGTIDRSLLQHLEPHVNIKGIGVGGYRGTEFPNWVGDSSFSNIVKLRLYDCKYCTRLPPLGQLASLEDLFISGFDSLDLVGADFYGSSNSIQPFRSLTKLIFDKMPELQQWNCCENEIGGDGFTAFPLLEKLTISNRQNLDISLRTLLINGCNKISSGRRDWDLRKFSSLTSFSIDSVEDIKSFPQMISLPSTLSFIWIDHLPTLKSLDYKGLHHLTSLTWLSIADCPNLERIPDEGLPESLAHLHIRECPLLKERCRKEQGEDWPKISHIQKIYIDLEEIRNTEAV